jgi:hypothetical protein
MAEYEDKPLMLLLCRVEVAAGAESATEWALLGTNEAVGVVIVANAEVPRGWLEVW